MSRFIESARRAYQKIEKLLGVELPKYNLGEINEFSVADTIRGYIAPDHMRIGREPHEITFHIGTVLRNMGFLQWTEGDDFQQFPKEYSAARRALHQLVKNNILKTADIEGHPYENMGYQIDDYEKLTELSKEWQKRQNQPK